MIKLYRHKLALLVAALFLAPAIATAQVAVVDAPAELNTLHTYTQSVTTYQTQLQQLAANNRQILNQITQIQAAASTLQYQKQQISGLMQQSGVPMINLILQNNSLMNSQAQNDPKMTAQFRQLVPAYVPGQNYTQYANTLNANTFQAEAQALGVGSTAVSSEQAVGQALSSLANNPVNELQALQEIIQVGKIQSGQLDKLVKIQSAMMKSMAYEWETQQKLAHAGASSDTVATAGMDSARDLCVARIQGFEQMTAAAQAPLWQACQRAAVTQSTASNNLTNALRSATK